MLYWRRRTAYDHHWRCRNLDFEPTVWAHRSTSGHVIADFLLIVAVRAIEGNPSASGKHDLEPGIAVKATQSAVEELVLDSDACVA
jgi:hypothetical protein